MSRLTLTDAHEDGCLLMLAISELASLAGHVPLGEWIWRFETDPSYRLFINGGTKDLWYVETLVIPRGCAVLERFYMPVALCHAHGGSSRVEESILIAAVQRESSWVKR